MKTFGGIICLSDLNLFYWTGLLAITAIWFRVLLVYSFVLFCISRLFSHLQSAASPVIDVLGFSCICPPPADTR